MSLILDALNRSRQDQGDVPGLEAQHHTPPEPAAPPYVLLLGVGLAIAAAVIVWLLVSRPEPAPTPAEAAAAQARFAQPGVAAGKPASPVESAPAPAAVEPRDARSGAPGDQPGTIAERAPATPEPAAADTRPVVDESGSPAAPAAAAPDPAVAALYQAEAKPELAPREKPAPKPRVTRPAQSGAAGDDAGAGAERTAAAPAEETVDIDAMVRQAQDELADARLAEHPAPFISDLSQQAKDAIPTILYSVHNYSGKPGQSTVVLNGKELKVGGSPAAGVKVDEILPDSVVLSFQGKQFRLRALNSWVNL